AQRQLAQLGQGVGALLLRRQVIVEMGEDPTREGDVAGLDLDVGGRRVGGDDRQQRVGGQRRGLVGVGVDDLRGVGHVLFRVSWCPIRRGTGLRRGYRTGRASTVGGTRDESRDTV